MVHKILCLNTIVSFKAHHASCCLALRLHGLTYSAVSFSGVLGVIGWVYHEFTYGVLHCLLLRS